MPGCHAGKLEFLVYGFARTVEPCTRPCYPMYTSVNRSPPPCIMVTTLYDSCNQRDVQTEQCLKYVYPLSYPPPPKKKKKKIGNPNFGWAITLRKLNRDLEGFVNNWRPNTFHTFTRRLFCYYEEVLNCPALRSTKSNCHQQFNWNNFTHTRIPLQLFAQFVAEPVTFGSHGSSVHVYVSSTTSVHLSWPDSHLFT